MANSIEDLVEQLREELRVHSGKNPTLPNPPSEFSEMHRIFQSEGFNFDPIVYQGNNKVTYALLDRSVRPERPNEKEGYSGYEFEEDGYVPILKNGQVRTQGLIRIYDTPIIGAYEEEFDYNFPKESRFALSWNDVHMNLAPKVANVNPRLAKLIAETKTKLRVPTRAEFEFAGQLRYPHFTAQNHSWEWLFDKEPKFFFPERQIGGHSFHTSLSDLREHYPLSQDWLHNISRYVAFRLQAVLPPQVVTLAGNW